MELLRTGASLDIIFGGVFTIFNSYIYCILNPYNRTRTKFGRSSLKHFTVTNTFELFMWNLSRALRPSLKYCIVVILVADATLQRYMCYPMNIYIYAGFTALLLYCISRSTIWLRVVWLGKCMFCRQRRNIMSDVNSQNSLCPSPVRSSKAGRMVFNRLTTNLELDTRPEWKTTLESRLMCVQIKN